MLISLHDVSVRYGTTLALDHVRLCVEPQDFLTVVGPNGAGKTTLLRVLLGLEKPRQGRVERGPSLRMGYVPQRLPINPSIPMHVARFLAMGNELPASALAETAAQVRITDILHHPVSTLSGGEMQRVLLARALLRHPQLLVLDEPAQNLDMAGQLEFYDLLDAYHARSGCAVVMVSHDLHLVMARTTRVLCLYRHICCEGAPQSVAQNPSFAQTMGPEVARLLAGYAHRHDHAHHDSHPGHAHAGHAHAGHLHDGHLHSGHAHSGHAHSGHLQPSTAAAEPGA